MLTLDICIEFTAYDKIKQFIICQCRIEKSHPRDRNLTSGKAC